MMSLKSIVRIAIPLGVALALVLAGTVSAFATWGDTTYASWRDISAAMPNQSPHGAYDTSSQKCKVCHAVHNARPGKEKLLMSSAADSCSYCHIVAKISDYVVYNGIEQNYKGTDFQNAHNTGYAGSTNQGCLDCHQVHAASARMTVNSALTEKILWGEKTSVWPDLYYDEFAGAPLPYSDGSGDPLTTDTKDEALSKWCTRCHVAAEYGYYVKDFIPGVSASHIMTATPGSYTLGSGDTTVVAWAASGECSSCHTSNFNDGSRRWPHYTAGARFLVSAGSVASATVAVQPNETKLDGVCLRCHRDVSRGVGRTF